MKIMLRYTFQSPVIVLYFESQFLYVPAFKASSFKKRILEV